MSHRAAQDRTYRFCAAFVLMACTGQTSDSGAPPSEAPPAMTQATVTCDASSGIWRFEAETDAWTGNGQVLLSTDGAYVEKHPLYSQSAAADGASDSLALTLAVASDWRDVVLGSSTIFNCHEADLTGILRVFTRDGDEQADCRAFGAQPERWATWSAGASCATVLEPT